MGYLSAIDRSLSISIVITDTLSYIHTSAFFTGFIIRHCSIKTNACPYLRNIPSAAILYGFVIAYVDVGVTR